MFLGHRFDNPSFDGAASIIIGVILAAVAVFLAYESKGLLIGESADADVVEHIRDLVEAELGVERVGTPLTMHFGPDQVLLNLDVQFQRDMPASEVMGVVDRLEQSIREAHPQIKRIFIEAETLKGR